MTEVSRESTSRKELLEKAFLELAKGGPLSKETKAYVNDGNGQRNALAELEHLREPSELDSAIDAARDAYMDIVLTKPNIINRLERKKNLRLTEAEYKAAVINKLAAYTTSDGTPKSALTLGQPPGIIRKATFNSEPLEMRDLAANHLHLIMDTLLQEHADRRHTIDEHHEQSPIVRLRENRKLHAGVAFIIFFAAFGPDIVHVPQPAESVVGDITLGIKIASGIVFGIDAPEVFRLWNLDRKNNKRTRELNNELAENQESTDLASRIVYGSTHYGSSKGFLAHSARSGTDDFEKNKAVLETIDRQIDNMHGDPGGRPYTGHQALGYAARFLQERNEQLKEIAAQSDPAEREKLYIKLIDEVLQEDLNRMKNGLTVSRARKIIMRGVAIAVGPFIPKELNAVSDAVSKAHDIASTTITGPVRKRNELEP